MVVARVVPALMQRLLREPLVHFLLAGAAIFGIAGLFEPEDLTGRQVIIDRDDLLLFMQGKAQVYDEETFAALLADMPVDERQQLVRDAALQDVLYREGLALDIAAADPLIRQRIVQQMRLLIMEEAAADIAVTDDDVRAYFREHAADYAQDPALSFSHVFLGGADGAARARGLAEAIADGGLVPAEALSRSDRFLYQNSYAEASREVVESQFGAAFADAAFALQPDEWSAPIRSDHGWHLVLVSEKASARQPEFADISDQVREDALADARQRAADAALDRVLAQYEIKVAGGAFE